jgi:hypothetical protein
MKLKGLSAIAKGLFIIYSTTHNNSSLLNSSIWSNETLMRIWVFFTQCLAILRMGLLGFSACKDTTENMGLQRKFSSS